MTPIELIQYVRPDGRVPFREWLLGLAQIEVRARIRARLDRLSLGNPGDVKLVGQGVFEMRFHFGPGWRVYFARQGNRLVILLSGGSKSSQRKDIRQAQLYWTDFQRRSA